MPSNMNLDKLATPKYNMKMVNLHLISKWLQLEMEDQRLKVWDKRFKISFSILFSAVKELMLLTSETALKNVAKVPSNKNAALV